MSKRALCLAIAALFLSPVTASTEADVPVVVELFTSQGCSSCPPADAYLQSLAQQPVDGVEIIPISWHVDYWNRLGWTDPYSSETATKRQTAYARQFKARSLYTPQMVVDGQSEFVGSDRRRGQRAIRAAAEHAKTRLEVKAQRHGDGVAISASVEKISQSWRAIALLTQDEIETSVKRGENTGRTLQHIGVVRASGVMAVAESGAWEKSLGIPNDAVGINAVVVVQDETGQVIAAGSQSIAL